MKLPKFWCDQILNEDRKQTIWSDDPTIYVKSMTVSREEVWGFFLFWGEKKIHFSAKQTVEKVERTTQYEVSWMLIAVGDISLGEPPYQFSNDTEYRVAFELCHEALLAWKDIFNPDKYKVIAVTARKNMKIRAYGRLS